MASLQRRLDSIVSKNPNLVYGEVDARIEAIKMLPLPSNIESLAGLFAYCHGHNQQIPASASYGVAEEIMAWRGKALSAYERLLLAALNDPKLTDFLKRYEGTYSPEAISARSNNEAENENRDTRLFVVCFIGVLVMGAIFAYFATRK